MSEAKGVPVRQHDETDGEQEQSGPNLVVMYSLIAVALIVAIGFAVLIVWPFYQHRH
jgi:hypothetical protein